MSVVLRAPSIFAEVRYVRQDTARLHSANADDMVMMAGV
jgi:hypothetical protein